MKDASECLQRAAVCETLAEQVQNASSTRVLRIIAGQWRRLARDSDRHKRMTGSSTDRVAGHRPGGVSGNQPGQGARNDAAHFSGAMP